MSATTAALFLPATDPAPSRQRCAACLTQLEDTDPAPACPGCGGLLEAVHRLPTDAAGVPMTAEALRARFAGHCCARPAGHPSGVWRFAPLVMPGAGDAVVSHPEGNTPLLARPALARYTGCEGLALKHEGHNPTGSFKDRGMTAAVTQAVRVGASAVACASTGNTSASLAGRNRRHLAPSATRARQPASPASLANCISATYRVTPRLLGCHRRHQEG